MVVVWAGGATVVGAGLTVVGDFGIVVVVVDVVVDVVVVV